MRAHLLAVFLLGCSPPAGSKSNASATGAEGWEAGGAPSSSDVDDPSAVAVDFEQRLAEVEAFISARAPSNRLAIVVEPPFVVVGDESTARVKERAEGTVRWAVDKLKDGFFGKDPERALTIWLFNGERSYRRHALALWNEQPDTPYGYYSSRNNALVMNIATGGGTLVHELVHPYVEVNFPSAPPWLNEGLGSLFEASRERDGKIVGVLNWRLPGLKEAIAANDLLSFGELFALGENEFYGEGSGTHYAQARYLLYYLQEKGLLHRFYHQFVRDAASDPSGLATLKAVLDRSDMRAFQRDWQRWVLALRYRD